jgi:hypothetical protein
MLLSKMRARPNKSKRKRNPKACYRVLGARIMHITKKECLRCPEGEVHSTGSILLISCKYQEGFRQINDVCNISEERKLKFKREHKHERPSSM